MFKIFLVFVFVCVPIYVNANECVVLLHGLARTAASMDKMEGELEAAGFSVVNIDYPSREHEIAQLAGMAVGSGISKCSKLKPDKINFVTHSLGGILVRYYLANNTLDSLGRVVMLGPPNGGSEVVDKLAEVPGFKFVNGPAGLQLGTGLDSVPNSIGAASFEVGIIAGTRSINLILSSIIPSTDDGKVSLENAHLQGEKEFMDVAVSHPFLMKDNLVIDRTIKFLKTGSFSSLKQ